MDPGRSISYLRSAYRRNWLGKSDHERWRTLSCVELGRASINPRLLMQLGSAHNAFIRLLPFVALSIGANIFYQAPVLNNWIALDTHLGTSKNTDSAFDQMQTLQQLVS